MNNPRIITRSFIKMVREELERRGEVKGKFFTGIGMDNSTVSHLATARHSAITLTTICKIADALGMKVTVRLEKVK